MGTETFVKGWEYGLEGACEGEKRTVIIPPQLAFGAHGRPPAIPANSHLKFHIEVVEVRAHGTSDLPHKQLDLLTMDGFLLGILGFLALVVMLPCCTGADAVTDEEEEEEGKAAQADTAAASSRGSKSTTNTSRRKGTSAARRAARSAAT